MVQVDKVRTYDGEESKLAKPDQFFLQVSQADPFPLRTTIQYKRSLSSQISTIPRLKERVDIMLFRRRFDILLSELMPDLGILHSAAIEIKASRRLREVLKVSFDPAILELGVEKVC